MSGTISAASADTTYHSVFEVECHFDAVRIVLINNSTVSWPMDKMAVATSSSLTDLVTPAGGSTSSHGWTPVTWSNRGQDGPAPGLGAACEAGRICYQSASTQIVGNGTAGPYTLPAIPVSEDAAAFLFEGKRLSGWTLAGASVTFGTVLEPHESVSVTLLAAAAPEDITPDNAATRLLMTDMPTSKHVLNNAYVISDWTLLTSLPRTDDVDARPILMVRVYNDPTSRPPMLMTLPRGAGWSGMNSYGHFPRPPVIEGYVQKGDHVGTPGGMTSRSAYSQARVMPLFQVLSRVRGASVLGAGDSITQGNGKYAFVPVTGASCNGTTATLEVDNSTGLWSVGASLVSRGQAVSGYNIPARVTSVTATSISYEVPSPLPEGGTGEAGYLVRPYDSWGRRACAGLSMFSRPVTWVCTAVAGTPSKNYLKNARSMIETTRPQCVTIPAFTPNNNNAGTTGADSTWMECLLTYDYALRQGVVPIIVAPVPCWLNAPGYKPDYYHGGVLRNLQKAREMAQSGALVIDVFDSVALRTDDGQYSGWQWASGMSDDGVHPGDTAVDILAAAARKQFRTALGID